MREPAFWWRRRGLAARHAGAGGGALRRDCGASDGAQAGERAGVPVVCIGNPTVGGAGKTPLALAVARMLTAAGERPVLLSRGYGGGWRGRCGSIRRAIARADVGDEPLLLARAAPTIVARDRVTARRRRWRPAPASS